MVAGGSKSARAEVAAAVADAARSWLKVAADTATWRVPGSAASAPAIGDSRSTGRTRVGGAAPSGVNGGDARPGGITVVQFAVSRRFARALYDSCRDVQMPNNNELVIAVLCGHDPATCTPENWLAYMGDKGRRGGEAGREAGRQGGREAGREGGREGGREVYLFSRLFIDLK